MKNTSTHPCILISLGLLLFTGCTIFSSDKPPINTHLIPVDTFCAQSSVNAVIFRKNSIDTYKDTQFISYYDEQGNVMLARRELGSTEWRFKQTPHEGDVTNAHNSISIGLDGNGVLHMAWGMHNTPLQYVRSERPGELTLTEKMPMTGQRESSVTYPQFYTLPDGDLLFMYRDGGSGRGDIVLNRYDSETQNWEPVAHPLIDGEGELSPYVNPLAIDEDGGWHLSWNWRETPDVASNHDMAYAYSPDQGQTWQKSTGAPYELPITDANAEIVQKIPRNSDLINQTSMAVDSDGNPVIATYWRPEGAEAPQFHIIRYDQQEELWQTHQVSDRNMDFQLSGGGTRRIPVSRPLVLTGDEGEIYLIFRDFDRGDGIFVAKGTSPDYNNWQFHDLATDSVGLWEPTHDPTTWKQDQTLHLFHQYVGQGQAETLEEIDPQPISVLEWFARD